MCVAFHTFFFLMIFAAKSSTLPQAAAATVAVTMIFRAHGLVCNHNQCRGQNEHLNSIIFMAIDCRKEVIFHMASGVNIDSRLWSNSNNNIKQKQTNHNFLLWRLKKRKFVRWNMEWFFHLWIWIISYELFPTTIRLQKQCRVWVSKVAAHHEPIFDNRLIHI